MVVGVVGLRGLPAQERPRNAPVSVTIQHHRTAE